MICERMVHTLLIASMVAWVAGRSEAQQYNLKALGVGPPVQVYLTNLPVPRINNLGQVVGNGSAGGYLYKGGVVSALPFGNSYGLDINNSGMTATLSSSTGDSYLSSPPYSSETDVGTLPTCLLGDNIATSLNVSGTVVGIANVFTICAQPFLYFRGQISSLGPSSTRAWWLAINNSNQIVGYYDNAYVHRAMMQLNGTITDLDPAYSQVYDSEALAINDAGQFIVNSNETYCTKVAPPPSRKVYTVPCRGQFWYPLLYSGTSITGLGALGSSGGFAYGINLYGDVVGTSAIANGTTHGFLYIAGSMTDLNSHAILNASGWTILQAYDINDSGQIVALGADTSGKQDVVVLTPGLVMPPALVSLTLNPTSVWGGIVGANTSTGTVTLSSAAPAGGVIVTLSSSSPLAQVPAPVRVAPNATTATFTVTTSMPVGTTSVTISATVGGTTKSATLTVIDVGS